MSAARRDWRQHQAHARHTQQLHCGSGTLGSAGTGKHFRGRHQQVGWLLTSRTLSSIPLDFNRRKQADEIAHENLLLFKRLSKVKPSAEVNREQLSKSYIQNQTYGRTARKMVVVPEPLGRASES